jgi:hypothetical protein
MPPNHRVVIYFFTKIGEEIRLAKISPVVKAYSQIRGQTPYIFNLHQPKVRIGVPTDLLPAKAQALAPW